MRYKNFLMTFGLGFFGTMTQVQANQTDTIPPSTPYNVKLSIVDLNTVQISWVGSGDDGREGQATAYQVRFAETPITDESSWEMARTVEVIIQSNGDEKWIRGYTTDLRLGDTGYFGVRAIDDAQNLSGVSEAVFVQIENPFQIIADRVTEDLNQALLLGYETNQRDKIYGCVSYYNSNLYPGKYGEHLKTCNVIDSNVEVATSLFRLVKADTSGTWTPVTSGSPPPNGIQYGYQGDTILYLCRGAIEKGVHSGYISPNGTYCSVPWGGRNNSIVPYDVLTE